MMEAVKAWGVWVVLGMALLGLAWLARPAPSPSAWPQATAQTREAMAQQLALAASRAWTQHQPHRAWQVAQVLHQGFPDTPQAQRVAPHLGRMEAAATAFVQASKWEYTELASAGWGELAQASIKAEPLAFLPDLPDSFLVVRSGSQASHRAVFFIPGVPMPSACHEPAGCVVSVRAPASSSQRIRPLPDRPGWWVFADFNGLASRLKASSGVSVEVDGVEEPLRFDTSGVDPRRLALP